MPNGSRKRIRPKEDDLEGWGKSVHRRNLPFHLHREKEKEK